MQRANNFRLGTHQSVAYTGTAGTIANAFGAGTLAVRVVATTAAFVKIGSSPTATSGDVYLPADKAAPAAAPGDRVVGGATVIATWL